MSPSAKGTPHVPESSNNFKNPNLNTVTTGEIEGSTSTEQVTAPVKPATREAIAHTGLRGFLETTKGKIVTGVVGLVAAGGLTLGGMDAAGAFSSPNPNKTVATAPAHPGKKPSSESTPKATPTATATPEATAGPTSYNYNLTEADVSSLLADNPNQLNQVDLKEKAKIVEYYAQTLPAFAQDWYAVSGNSADVLPATISANNTPDEINAFITMSARQAMTLEQSDGFHFDQDAADNYISAQLINGTLSNAYGSLTTFAASLAGPDSAPSARTLAASNYLQMPVIDHASAKYTDAAGYTCIDMTTTQTLNTGGINTANSTACLVTNENGSVWMMR
jgi:hypothetical protein